VIPRKQFYTKLFFLNTVILEPLVRSRSEFKTTVATSAMAAVYVPSIHRATRSGWVNGWAVFASAACKLLILMVGATGLEPVTSCV
jgi:hypothetical protein